MGNKLKKLDEHGGMTVFGGPRREPLSWFSSSGRIGQFFARFFATKAQPYVAKQGAEENTPIHPLGGDTIVSREVVTGESEGAAGIGIIKGVRLPEIENARKTRNNHFESMDEYPEISAAFDIYADDCTQKDLKGEPWSVISESSEATEEIKKLFNTIKLERYYWDIIRNMVKYGDSFIELVLDLNMPRLGIQKIKILNPNYLIRVENEYGYLTDFLQEIPKKSDWTSMGWQSETMNKSEYIGLDKNQIVHFRLFTSDPKYYPYGRSIAALAIRTFRSLRLMEDAMLIYRLSRAPERRVFYINIGNLSGAKAEMFIERLKQKFKKEKFFNPANGSIDERYNPMSFDEDFFVPYTGNKETKIEVLPGAQNLGEIDDVKYFRDKILASMKIPKDYIIEQDKSPERKANLSQLDVKFARAVMRVKRDAEAGLETIGRRHLRLKGFPGTIINSLRVFLPDPSDMFTKRKLDVEEQRSRVVQAILGTGLFSKKYIYKVFYDLSEDEINKLKSEIKREMVTDPTPQGGMLPGSVMPGDVPPGGNPNPDTEAGGQEPNENIPPTNEDVLTFIKQNLRDEEDLGHKLKVLERVKEKYLVN